VLLNPAILLLQTSRAAEEPLKEPVSVMLHALHYLPSSLCTGVSRSRFRSLGLSLSLSLSLSRGLSLQDDTRWVEGLPTSQLVVSWAAMQQLSSTWVCSLPPDCRLLCHHATGDMEFTVQDMIQNIVRTAVWHHAGHSYLCDHLQAFLSPSRAL